MIEAKEAAARVAVADYEARRAEARAKVRAARRRLAATVTLLSLFFAVRVFLEKAKIEISGAEACGYLLLFAMYAAWAHYRTEEKLEELKEEVERLRNKIEERA